MKKILITGSSGFVGKHLYKSLSDMENAEIHTLSRSKGGKNHFSMDILDFNKYDDYDVIYHLAAAIYPSDCEKDPYNAWKINSKGTHHVANQLSKKQKLIYPSTSHVYGYSSNPISFSENSNLHPGNVYGLTKMLGENVIKELSNKNGFSYNIFRVFHSYGPGQKQGQIIPDVINKIKTQKEVIIRGYNSYISPVYIGDLIEVLTSDEIPSGTYNVCGDCISVGEIYRKIAFIVGNSNLIEEQDYSDKKYMCGNREKISEFKDKWISLEEGILKTLNS